MTNHPSRIFLNDNIISHATQCGIARYFRNVADGVIAHFGSEVVICSPEARDYGSAKYIRSLRFRGSHRIRFHDKLASLAAYLEKATVFFSPYYGKAQTSAAQIFAVHDMIYELFPQYFSRDNSYIHDFIIEKRLCIERASALIAISASTARDILKIYPQVDLSKIITVHYGVDDFFFAGVEARGQFHTVSRKPYFLYVGNREYYKNFLGLLTAFGQSGLAGNFDLLAVCPRGSKFVGQEAEYISKYNLQSDIQLLISPAQTTLRSIYSNAVALVYPSEYEGFGLPILEAMASGTLVATSNVSSMPEIGGDVAFYFDPLNAESIADCLERVAHLSSEERSARVERGIARARTFTWERCQQQTVEVLKRFI